MNKKSFRVFPLLFGILVLGLSVASMAAKGGKKGPPADEIAVTVNFYADAGTRINNDGADYTSAIGEGGAISRFILDLRDDDPDRELRLEFSDCAPSNTCNGQPAPVLILQSTANAIMFLDLADGGDFIDIPLNTSAIGVLLVNFDDSTGTAYGLRFDSARESGTSDVQIKRTGDESCGGNAWDITPYSPATAILYKRGGTKGPAHKRRADIGHYTMPFRFTIEE